MQHSVKKLRFVTLAFLPDMIQDKVAESDHVGNEGYIMLIPLFGYCCTVVFMCWS